MKPRRIFDEIYGIGTYTRRMQHDGRENCGAVLEQG